MYKVKVELKNGKVIEVWPREIEGLKAAGVLKKEFKEEGGTKEEKKTGETKEKKIKSRSKNWYPGPGETEEPAPMPVNIGKDNIIIPKKK